MRQPDGDLWTLVRARPHIDPRALASAIESEAGREGLDYRTRLLIHDGVQALEKYWGKNALGAWLAGCPFQEKIDAIRQEQFERPGFPSLEKRLMNPTQPDDIHEYFRTLAAKLHTNARFVVGSVALIVEGYLQRGTEDIDVVDEVPVDIRTQYALLDELERRYGLKLAHFASHYLPDGWEQRTHTLGMFGGMEVRIVDAYDVFLSKLFSAREKDLDDLRELKPQLEKETLEDRLRTGTAGLRADEKLRRHAEENWYILYGESFPS
jgi:hypothetical protein